MDRDEARRILEDATRHREREDFPLPGRPVVRTYVTPFGDPPKDQQRQPRKRFGYWDLNRAMWGNHDPIGIWGPSTGGRHR